MTAGPQSRSTATDRYEPAEQTAAAAPLRWFTLEQATGHAPAESIEASPATGLATGLPATAGSAAGADRKVFDSTSTHAQIEGELRAAGFCTLLYAAFETAGRHRLRTYALRDFVATGYLERYLAAGLEFGDPRLAAIEHSGLPCVWDLARMREDSRASPTVAALADLLERHHLASGIMFGLALPSVGLRVVISAASGESGAAWIDDRVVSQALMAGLSVHRAVQQYVEQLAISARDPDLDAEQTSVLDQLVLGLSAREISERLSLSVHQVSHQVRVLQRKFHVVNRMQLAYVAGRRERLFEPEAAGPASPPA